MAALAEASGVVPTPFFFRARAGRSYAPASSWRGNNGVVLLRLSLMGSLSSVAGDASVAVGCTRSSQAVELLRLPASADERGRCTHLNLRGFSARLKEIVG